MISPKKYLPVKNKIFCAPLIKENLRADFSSSENKLDDLPLLTILMLRDGKTADDISAVTMLPLAVIKNVLDELKNLGIIDAQNIYKLPEHTKNFLTVGNYINFFNMSAPQIFSDPLTKSPVMLPQSVKLEKTFDEKICAAVVKNSEQISVVPFEEISEFVKNFLLKNGAWNLIDELKVLRQDKTTEIFFAPRQIRYLPVIGENNFTGCVNLNSARKINAELPVRKFKVANSTGEWRFSVDLLLGTIFKTDDELDDSAEVTLSFKPSPNFTGEELKTGVFSVFDEVIDEGIHYIKISIDEEVLGDFL